MNINYRFLLLGLVFVFQINAQTPGVSTFYEQFPGDTREYIEYIPGNLPIIISAPHGGVKQSGQTIGSIFYPDNDGTLPDRTCGTNERDDNTDILIREIQAEIFALTGCYAHVIINNLHRSKLDPNREQTEATCGDSDAIDHWNAWHSFIDQASTSIETNFGKGLYIDLHGQSHSVPRIEIGYNITAGQLNTGNLNSTTNIDRSTIKNLVSNNLNNHTHEELIRGDNSLGQLFQEQPAVFYNANVNPGCGVTSGYRAVPSNSVYGSNTCDDTRPYSNAYFDGNFYNNRRHGSGNGSGTNAGSNDGGGSVDGIMTEVNRRVRDLGTYNGNFYDNRPQTLVPFAKEYAAVVLDYIDIHYNDFATFSYTSNSYDVNASDPTPTITGLSGGIFSSTTGLVIDTNTGVIDLSASTTGSYIITYAVGSCGYYKETYNIQITGTLIDTEAPTTPTNLMSNNITLTTIDLNWTASTDNVAVTDYEVYQDGSLIATIPSTSYQVTGLANGTTYAFYIIAKDAANNSSPQSTTLNATTLVPDNQDPSAPTNLISSGITATTVDLSWTASTDNIGVTGYEIYQNGNLITTVSSTTYQVTGLTNATAYGFYIIAKDAAGNSSNQSNTINITTLDNQGPTAPTNLTASNITAITVDLSWIASTDNTAVTGYEVYQDGNLITTVGSTIYQVSGLTNGTGYSFYIIAKDIAGNSSAQSNVVNVNTLDTEVPTAPTNLISSNVLSSSVDLNWTASTDNVSVTDYEVYQDGNLITTTVSTSYQVTGLNALTNYVFYVIAKDAAGNSSIQSNSESITTSAVVTCSGTTITSFPYLETFDSGMGDWTQDTGDDGDWTLDDSGTPSNNTGPSDDISSGGNYFYTEASSNGLGSNATVILTSPCYDLSGLTEAYFSFYYHMFGANVGTLDLEITLDDGSNWSNIFTVSGNIGNSWNSQNINLDSYLGETVKFRFIGTTGNGWSSDITIDHIGIGDPIIPDYCGSNGNNTNDEFIGRVQINTLDNNNSGAGTTATGYSDFTANTGLTTNLLAGSQYTISITPVWTGNTFNEAYAVWIDYNHDGDFFDSGELVWSLAANQNPLVSGSFTIPTDVAVINYGETRMRVSMKYNGIPTACESFDFGEVEDYTINLAYDGLLFENNSWLPNAPSISTTTENALILDGTYFITSDIELNNLTVNTDAIVEVMETGSIKLNGDLTNTGDLILNSISNQYSSLIVNGNVTGDVVYRRHVNTNASTTGNDLISAPLTGQTFADFATANLNIFSNPSLPTEKLFGPFDKVSGSYLTYDTNVPAEAAIVLNPAIGYRSASTNNGTFEFRGTVNTTAINTNIFLSGSSFPEWNLIGNPYPSYIKLSDFLAANSSQFDIQSAGIYGYDGNASNGWTIWNQAYSDANPNAMITPGQGFLVASAVSTGNIMFTPSMRSIGSSDDFILGREDANPSIMHLQLALTNTVEGIYNTDFYFTNNASNGMDFNYDASIYGDQAPSSFALYSHLIEENEGVDMSIQSLDLDALSSAVIPLGIHIQEGQQFAISISQTSLPENAQVYIEDTSTNTFTLLNSSDYIFTSNEDLNTIGRYYLHFSQQTLSTNSNDENDIEIYTTTQPKLLVVKGQLYEDSDLSIFDLQGRLIKTYSLNSSQTIHQLDLSSIAVGVYVVTLKNKSQEKIKKVIIK